MAEHPNQIQVSPQAFSNCRYDECSITAVSSNSPGSDFYVAIIAYDRAKIVIVQCDHSNLLFSSGNSTVPHLKVDNMTCLEAAKQLGLGSL